MKLVAVTVQKFRNFVVLVDECENGLSCTAQVGGGNACQKPPAGAKLGEACGGSGASRILCSGGNCSLALRGGGAYGPKEVADLSHQDGVGI